MINHTSNVKSHRGIITDRRVDGAIVSRTSVIRNKLSKITYDAVATDAGGVAVTNKVPAKRPVVAGEPITDPMDEPEVEAADYGQECSLSVFGSEVRLYVAESLILDPCPTGEDPPVFGPGDPVPGPLPPRVGDDPVIAPGPV